MCRAHWRAIPRPLRTDVWRAWAAKRRGMRAAIEAASAAPPG